MKRERYFDVFTTTGLSLFLRAKYINPLRICVLRLSSKAPHSKTRSTVFLCYCDFRQHLVSIQHVGGARYFTFFLFSIRSFFSNKKYEISIASKDLSESGGGSEREFLRFFSLRVFFCGGRIKRLIAVYKTGESV